MKRIVFLVVSILALNLSVAQSALDQGAIAVRGGINFTSTWFPNVDNAVVTFAMSPGVSYNVIDQLALGAGVDIFHQSFSGDNINTTFFFAPFVRYTFDRDLPFFVDVAYSVGTIKLNNTDAVSGSNIRPSVGYSAFLNKSGSASLEPVFFYQHSRVDGEAFTNNIGLGVNFVWNFMNINGN